MSEAECIIETGDRQAEAPAAAAGPGRRQATALAAILVAAALLRLVGLGNAPPGLNQDEAANAWNAYCLLKTGTDQVADPWPVFYSHALGGNRTTLYYYLLLPFQAVGGLNVVTTRLPSAVGGVLTVWLIYAVGARLFEQSVGLLAAAILAVNPWHLHLSRWGMESNICPLLAVAGVWLLLWTGIPDPRGRGPKVARAVAAGGLIGVFLYGYGSIRLFLPALLLGVVLASWRGWLAALRTRRGAASVAAFFVALAAVGGPLAWQHVAHPEGVSKRSAATLVWAPDEPAASKLQKASARYALHFGADFLLVNGDHAEQLSVPLVGQFHWYVLPLWAVGVPVLLWRARRSAAARILLVWVLAYPLGDTFHGHDSAHALRSSPGVCGLVLLAAVGAVAAWRWLCARSRTVALAMIPALAVVAVSVNVEYLTRFFIQYDALPPVYHRYHVDLVKAFKWLKPRLAEVDGVYCTTVATNQPYIISLVVLGWEPERWFAEPRDVVTPYEWDIYLRYGKMHFLYSQECYNELAGLRDNDRSDRVVLILRPDALGFGEPTEVICAPNGEVTLCIYDLTI